jgi:hypothetical protein
MARKTRSNGASTREAMKAGEGRKHDEIHADLDGQEHRREDQMASCGRARVLRREPTGPSNTGRGTRAHLGRRASALQARIPWT